MAVCELVYLARSSIEFDFEREGVQLCTSRVIIWFLQVRYLRYAQLWSFRALRRRLDWARGRTNVRPGAGAVAAALSYASVRVPCTATSCSKTTVTAWYKPYMYLIGSVTVYEHTAV